MIDPSVGGVLSSLCKAVSQGNNIKGGCLHSGWRQKWRSSGEWVDVAHYWQTTRGYPITQNSYPVEYGISTFKSCYKLPASPSSQHIKFSPPAETPAVLSSEESSFWTASLFCFLPNHSLMISRSQGHSFGKPSQLTTSLYCPHHPLRAGSPGICILSWVIMVPTYWKSAWPGMGMGWCLIKGPQEKPFCSPCHARWGFAEIVHRARCGR